MDSRTSGYKSGYRVQKWNTHEGIIYLLISMVHDGGYVYYFITSLKCSEIVWV